MGLSTIHTYRGPLGRKPWSNAVADRLERVGFIVDTFGSKHLALSCDACGNEIEERRRREFEGAGVPYPPHNGPRVRRAAMFLAEAPLATWYAAIETPREKLQCNHTLVAVIALDVADVDDASMSC